MTITRLIARSSIAPIFLVGGFDALKNPDAKAVKADLIAKPLSTMLGIDDNPVRLVRINGGIQLAAGTLLILGKAPRLASTVLAASLVPTTLAGHRFWDETDPTIRAQQRTAFLKNAAIVGGLILAAVDKNGAPSLRWRTDKAARRVADHANKNFHRASAVIMRKKSTLEAIEAGAVGAAALIGRNTRLAMEHAATAAERLASDGVEQTGRVAGIGADLASAFGKNASKSATHLSHALVDSLTDAAELAKRKVASYN